MINQPRAENLKYAKLIVERVCRLASYATCIDDLRQEAIESGLVSAVENHDTPVIFDWLMDILSFQGISDAVAQGFINQHGNVRWTQIKHGLPANPDCQKLAGYWAFTRCLYHKGLQTCSEPDHFPACALPRHDLRNGRLNQTAYSLFLFIRDVAGEDLVKWIEAQLSPYIASSDLVAARAALLEPMRSICGVSDKVVAMALATLLMGAGANRPGWFSVGASFIVIDTLVHNFLVRTGIMRRLGLPHLYGPACYRPGGCADVLGVVATNIDARRFNIDFPKVFPRFIQHSIWRFCAQSYLDVCNGNRIDDRGRCEIMWCRLYEQCDRLCLRDR